MLVRNLCLAVVVCSFVLVSCDGQNSGPEEGDGGNPGSSAPVTIRVTGSDTMVNLAQAWQENYNKSHPNVSLQVSGGGTGPVWLVIRP